MTSFLSFSLLQVDVPLEIVHLTDEYWSNVVTIFSLSPAQLIVIINMYRVSEHFNLDFDYVFGLAIRF